MTDLITYWLRPPHDRAALSFHFGRRGIGLEEAGETMASDSLFAALVAQAATLSPARGPAGEPAWATPFADAGAPPPLALSSLFPTLGKLVLLPRPALPIPDRDAALRAAIGKGFKKLRYLSPALFAAVCAARPFAEEPLILQGGQVWISPAEAAALPAPWSRRDGEGEKAWSARLKEARIWTIDSVPRVTVDRASNTSAYYEVGRVSYAPEAGLALLVRFHDPSAKPMFERLLGLLGESGLGGRRSSGYGAFRCEPGPALDLAIPAGGRLAVLLSRYLPDSDGEFAALQRERSRYQLVEVGGWLYSVGVPAQRRRRIRMVAEGSVIDISAGMPRGTLADVRPDYRQSRDGHPIVGRDQGTAHPVYRSGLALALPIPDQQEGA